MAGNRAGQSKHQRAAIRRKVIGTQIGARAVLVTEASRARRDVVVPGLTTRSGFLLADTLCLRQLGEREATACLRFWNRRLVDYALWCAAHRPSATPGDDSP